MAFRGIRISLSNEAPVGITRLGMGRMRRKRPQVGVSPPGATEPEPHPQETSDTRAEGLTTPGLRSLTMSVQESRKDSGTF